jgi:hypothetical protein
MGSEVGRRHYAHKMVRLPSHPEIVSGPASPLTWTAFVLLDQERD